MSLKDKTLLITGASRGIGRAIALRAARDGASIAIVGKTVEPQPKLVGTIHDAADEVIAAGGKAIALAGDIRDEEQVRWVVAQTVEQFGGIDILVNNASAISLTGTLDTPMKKFDLMHQVNQRGTFITSQACLPHLLQSGNPQILTLCPPPSLDARWFGPHLAYTLAKMGMSFVTMGLAEEFRGRVSVNGLWPRTLIATAALTQIEGGVRPEHCRSPEIVADAAHAILTRPNPGSGRFFIDEEALREAGINDLDRYSLVPEGQLQTDLFL
ncbi:SDR family oxidoreductase [Lacibacterium aquatile]|uniref:SDR family oxidoreductase n=1 Tax=Lacibacterium aquatile TaxID=1168082 RepID=A0ABW5DT11_9PROT